MADLRVQQQVFKKLASMEQQGDGQSHKSKYSSAFIIHLILKCIPIGLYLLKGLFENKISNMLMIQLILIAVVIDFWFTKNITGRKMVGLKWEFDEDQYGVERFKVEGRVNQEYIDSLNSKLFWLILAVYCIIPLIFILFELLRGRTNQIKFDKILLSLAIFVGGAVNLFFFWKARSTSSSKRGELNQKLDRNFMDKMGAASMIAYT